MLGFFGGTIIATSIPAIEKHFANIEHIAILSKLVLTLPALFIKLYIDRLQFCFR